MIGLVFLLAFILAPVYGALDEKYVATCNFYVGKDNQNIIERCDSAIFSADKNYDLAGPIEFVASDFCKNISTKHKSANMIAAVPRGNCSFDTKASVAYFASYQGLIIINSDLDVFPMGGIAHVMQVPTVMVDSAFLRYKRRNTTLYGRIQFGNAEESVIVIMGFR